MGMVRPIVKKDLGYLSVRVVNYGVFKNPTEAAFSFIRGNRYKAYQLTNGNYNVWSVINSAWMETPPEGIEVLTNG